ncbi:MAG: choice-of-anchor tandem repeat GloVer-containing protein [Candidatus Cybelea sp.]
MNKFRNFVIIFVSAAFLAACGGGTFSPSAGSGIPMGVRERSSAVSPAGSGYKVLYAFKGAPDGASPYGGLVALNGTLYGTTLNGSKNYCSSSCGSNLCYLGCGTIFTVTLGGAENIIYNFDGTFNGGHDGSWPWTAPTVLNGQFFGTTSSAGAFGDGVVYTTTPSGSEQVIYSFKGSGSADAQDSQAALIPLSRKLYGTSVYGGSTGCGGAGCGTVFSVTTGGTEKVVYSFKGGNDGERLYGPVTAMNGKLYGATLEGGGTGCGGNGCGAIFELSLRGKEHVLYRFADTTDGAFPNGLTAVKGVLYGTTEGGGSRSSGTFFSVTTSGTLTTLYNFKDIPDGNLPGASLIYSKGEFYGTTVGGGTAGHGSVFKINAAGTESVLHSFLGGTDGQDPNAPVHMLRGVLYGTTISGGNGGCANGYGCGTIFKVKP